MFKTTDTVNKICSSQKGNGNLLTAGGIACLAIDAAYVILADEVKIPIAAILALAGIAGIGVGALNAPPHRTRPRGITPQSRPIRQANDATTSEKTETVEPKLTAFTATEIDGALDVMTKIDAIYKRI